MPSRQGSGTFAVTKNQTLTSDAVIKQQGGVFAVTKTQTLQSDAVVYKSLDEQNISSDAFIKKSGNDKTLPSNSVISVEEEIYVFQKELDSYGYIKKIKTSTLTSDAVISSVEEIETYVFQKTLTSDAYIVKVTEKTLTSDAFIANAEIEVWVFQKTLTSDSYVKKDANAQTLNSDAFIQLSGAEIQKTILSDAYIKKTATEATIASDAVLCKINIPHIIQPLTGEIINKDDEYIIFTLPDNIYAANIHVELMIRTPTSPGIILLEQSWSGSGRWEYYDGADWQPWPAGGVSHSYAGNQGRFNPSIVAAGTYRIKMRGVKL